MSVRAMAWVWEQDMPREMKFVLLAYADHADHNGKDIYPGIESIAKKTGYDERSIQRITKKLCEAGYLIEDGNGLPTGRGYTRRWSMPIEMGDIAMSPITNKGDKSSIKRVTKNAIRVTKTPDKGDIAMSPEPLTINHPINPAEVIPTAREIERVWVTVTGMVTFSGKTRDSDMERLDKIIRVQNGNAVEYCKQFYEAWRERGYYKGNSAWLDWAIAGEIPKRSDKLKNTVTLDTDGGFYA